jgi:glyoxylase-like metal-dependent hydrolase (beta-lactamase superfamily II)
MTAGDEAFPDTVYRFSLTVEFEGREVTVNPTGVERDRGLLLADTGFPRTLDQVESAVAAAGFDLADVVTVLLTHQDADHAGNLAALQERVDPFVIAHGREAPVVNGRQSPRGPDPDERSLRGLAVHGGRADGWHARRWEKLNKRKTRSESRDAAFPIVTGA